MSPAKPEDYSLLLEVFYDGLEYGLISRDEVVVWADQIIKEENEPDYFFIDVSLSRDINNLSNILKAHVPDINSLISARVILGITYQRLLNKAINTDKVIDVVRSVNYDNILSSKEDEILYGLEMEQEILYPDGDITPELKETYLNILSIYKGFNLNNYEQWPEINNEVEEALKSDQIKASSIFEAYKKAAQKKNLIKQLWQYGTICEFTLVALFILLVDYKLIQSGFLSKFNGDFYQFLILYLDVYEFYFIVRVIYLLWKKVM